ncbi:MAG: restriction endonuclease subunit S, partial [Candidatus Methanoperedenaceae archaeon]|nr:restriction endonuclease subunit S [Candidatus Methanoperedenaceae archaeon]
IGGEHLNKDGGFIFDNIKFIPIEFYENMKRGRIVNGDVLVVKDGATTGKVSLVREDFPYQESAVNEHVFICRPNQKSVLPEYLFYNLFCPLGQNKILRSFHGAAQGGINTQFANDYELPLPPLPTQRRIVSILEKAEETTRLRAQADELTDRLLQSVFLEMFGDPVRNPKGWEIEQIDKVCSKVTDGEHNIPPRTENGIPLLMATNVRDGYVDLTEVSYISEGDHQKSMKRCNPEEGDVLLVCVGATIGRVAIVPKMGKFSLVRSVALLKPNNNKITSQYLLWCLKTKSFQYRLLSRRNTSAQAGLYLNELKKIKLPIPSLFLQQKFARIVEKIESMRQTQNQSKQQIEDLFSALMQKAFSGELDKSIYV